MSVLVLGRSGQLASHLEDLLRDAEYWGRQRFDLSKPADLAEQIRALNPSFIVNAAAYTAVDKAEVERDVAWCVNAEAPAMAARAAAALDVPLVHISTDYIFDGTKTGEYVPSDAARPINVYGESKLEGELAVRRLAPKSWILRTSWLFSEHGSNFVKTILRLAAEPQELRVVADQFGRPTYAGDLARLIARIAADPESRVPYGTYHAVGGAVTSRHAFAEAIVAAAHARGLLPHAPVVTAISTTEPPTLARRPRNSALRPSRELHEGYGADFDWARGLICAIERSAPHVAPGVAKTDCQRRKPS
jgi:dTDP-4-dehydrorhamnose reductase